jgi:hypothetical protein
MYVIEVVSDQKNEYMLVGKSNLIHNELVVKRTVWVLKRDWILPVAGISLMPEITISNIATEEITFNNEDFIGVVASLQVVN